MRVLVGGVGYRYLRDGSVGPLLTERLAAELASTPSNGVEVEDLSYGPVALSMNLQERPDYDRLVVFAAVERGRSPGTVNAYRWDGALPDHDQIQERVAEAVTGVISLDNLLIVCGALGGLPADVRVVEIEPEDLGWGEGFSQTVEDKLPELRERVWSLIKP
ncbi:MAG: hydrogenase maturation protease [Actinomycetota bacterium]|nr:hydrogenase maturation protease [Actinomycetota bacterium]